MSVLNSKSEFNALNPPHIEVDSQHLTLDPIPQFQRTFFKAGLLANRLPDSQVKFEPNAVSIWITYYSKIFWTSISDRNKNLEKFAYWAKKGKFSKFSNPLKITNHMPKIVCDPLHWWFLTFIFVFFFEAQIKFLKMNNKCI